MVLISEIDAREEQSLLFELFKVFDWIESRQSGFLFSGKSYFNSINICNNIGIQNVKRRTLVMKKKLERCLDCKIGFSTVCSVSHGTVIRWLIIAR